jgi:hypothetical protein
LYFLCLSYVVGVYMKLILFDPYPREISPLKLILFLSCPDTLFILNNVDRFLVLHSFLIDLLSLDFCWSILEFFVKYFEKDFLGSLLQGFSFDYFNT